MVMDVPALAATRSVYVFEEIVCAITTGFGFA
jgi:hypothetical protein